MRSELVRTSHSCSTGYTQLVTTFVRPRVSTSTMQTRQQARCSGNASERHSTGMGMPLRLATSHRYSPLSQVQSFPSMVICKSSLMPASSAS